MILPLLTALKTPAEMGTKASLKGSVRFLIATSTETAQVPEVLDATLPLTKTLAGLKIDVNTVARAAPENPANDRIKLALTVHRGTYPKELWNAMAKDRYAYLQVSLVDRGNRALAAPDVLPPNPAQRATAPDTMPDADTFTYRYEVPLALISGPDGTSYQPSRLVLEAATAVREVTVPLNLRDVPIQPAPY